MPCELRIRDDLSMDDVRLLSASYNVRVTPHVGNLTPEVLLLPQVGVYMLCVDHTVGIRDWVGNPHLLIKNGVARTICSHSDRMTTHAYVTECIPDSGCVVGTSLSQMHVGVTRALYPSASVVTHTEHLRTNAEGTLRVLEAITELAPRYAWWRSVSENGVVTAHKKQELPKDWREYEQNIFTLSNPKSGWLLHNRIAILMDFIEQSEGGTLSEIYHLSGAQMVHYIVGEMKVLSRMYDHVRTRLGLKQETITLNLVPFASFQFVSRASQKDAVSRLCLELERDAPREMIIRECLRDAPDMFAQTKDQNHFSQHDSAATGESVLADESAQYWSMALCEERGRYALQYR